MLDSFDGDFISAFSRFAVALQNGSIKFLDRRFHSLRIALFLAFLALAMETRFSADLMLGIIWTPPPQKYEAIKYHGVTF